MRPTSLEKTLEYTFKKKDLLNQAITHSSCFNEKKDIRQSDNEKLEYLGDAILNSIITILLYKKYKNKDEGFLSNARSCLVKREALTEVAITINLQKHMSYGNGDQNVPEESKVLSNMMESLIGAIYLDGGMRKVTKVIKQLFTPFFTDEKLTEKTRRIYYRNILRNSGGFFPNINSLGRLRVALPSSHISGRTKKPRVSAKARKKLSKTLHGDYSIN
jgi:ribonuclease-3